MGTALTYLWRALLGLTLIIALIILWLGWSNRDIPVEDLEQRYGCDNLQVLDVDGVQLRYKVQGQGPPLVLLHSHFYNMRQWDSWVEVLADRFTLIRYDLTSHGLTGPDPRPRLCRDRRKDRAGAHPGLPQKPHASGLPAGRRQQCT